MDILELIKNRRTIRKYQDKPIPKEILDKIIEAGIWGPSPHNSQPWRFVVVTDKYYQKKIIETYDGATVRLLTGVSVLFRKSLEILKATRVIVFVYNRHPLSRKTKMLGRKYYFVSNLAEIEGIAAAIQNMHLVATSLGVGMAWLTMPLLVRKGDNLINKSGEDLVAVLAIGYPCETGVILPRRPLTEIVQYIHEK